MPYSLFFFLPFYLSCEFVSIFMDVTCIIVEYGQGSNSYVCPNSVSHAVSEAAAS